MHQTTHHFTQYAVHVYGADTTISETFIAAEHDDAALDCADVLVAALGAHSADVFTQNRGLIGQVLSDGTRLT